MQVDTSDPDFIDRFWVGYWQGYALACRAFDGWPEPPVLLPGWTAWNGEDPWPGDAVLDAWR
jgi:hypothetical protein